MTVGAPKVSVILPTNKGGIFLHQAVKSILNQTLQDFELIVIVNGDHQSAVSQLSEFQDTRIKIIKTDLQQLCFALNLGIDAARSELIARMDSDDIASTERLLKQLTFLNAHPEIDVVGSQYQRIDSSDSQIGQASSLPLTSDEIASKIFYDNPMVHPSIMMRKSFILKNKGYFLDYAEDYDLWIRALYNNAQLANIDEVLLFYRIHENQMTSASKKFENFVKVALIKLKYLLLTKDFRFAVALTIDFIMPFYRAIRRRLRLLSPAP